MDIFNESTTRNMTLLERAKYGALYGQDADFIALAEACLFAHTSATEAQEELFALYNDDRGRLPKDELDNVLDSITFIADILSGEV